MEHAVSYVSDFLAGVPVALLAIGGALLLRRSMSIATVLVVLGFSMVLAAELVNYASSVWQALVTYRLIASIDSKASFAGQWIAAIGFVWYAIRY